MKVHTTDFKNEIKKFGKQISSKVFRYFSFSLITEDSNFLITENGLNLVLEQFDKDNKEQIIEENINDIKIIQDSQLLRSLMKKIELETMVELYIKDVIRVNFGILVNGNYEYLDYGNYVVYKKTYNASNKSWDYVCYDMMLYSMIQYKRLNISYPITIRNYLKAIADKMGIGFASKDDDFTNYNQLIEKDYFQGKNVTLRDMLDFLSQATASVICINENDELEVRYPQNVGEYETKEGISLSIENVDDGSDLVFDLNGNTTQDGTPTPTSPIAVETVTGRQVVSVSNGTDTQNYEINLGKNIADIYLGGMQKGHTETINGITFTINDDGTISGSGTATAQSNFRFFGTWTSITQNIPIDRNSYYYFSSNGTKENSLDTGYFYVRVAKINSDGTLSYSTVNNNSSFTGYDYINLIMLTVGQGATVDFNGKWCQIEKGNQATSFVEYKTPTELCKIVNYKDFIRKGTGKNLLQLTDGTYSNNGITAVVNNGIIVLNGAASGNSFITIPSNIDSIYSSLRDSYTLCSNNERTVGSTTTSGTYADVRIMGNNGVSFIWRNILGNQNASQTSTPSTYTNISLQIRTGSGLSYSNFVIKPQLEKGNQATLFEAYGFKDKWYLYKTIGKTTYVGTESWGMNTAGDYKRAFISIEDSLDLGQSRSSDVYCTYFKNSTTNDIGIIFRYGKQIYCYVQNSITTINEFKTWLSSHNMEVYYPLTTPTTTEITDTELINQLESVKLLEGLNNVLITSSNLSTPVKMTYLKYFDTIDEEYLKDVNVNFGEKFGPVNKITLVDSENKIEYTIQDDISIEKNNLIEIRMTDNPILLNSDQELVCNNILKRLSGIYYSINDFSLTGICYYDYLDIFKVSIEGNSYKCLLLNDEIEITQGLQETIYSDPLENSDTETDNYKTNNLSNKEVQQKIIKLDDNKVDNKSVVNSINNSKEPTVVDINKVLNRKTITATTDSDGFIDVKLNSDYIVVCSTAQFSSNDYGFAIPYYYYNNNNPKWLVKLESKNRTALTNTQITVIVYYAKIKEEYEWQI